MGFFWGVDQDSMVGTKKPLFFMRKKNFFNAFPPQKTVKSSSDGRAHLRNRSGVVELVGSRVGKYKIHTYFKNTIKYSIIHNTQDPDFVFFVSFFLICILDFYHIN